MPYYLSIKEYGNSYLSVSQCHSTIKGENRRHPAQNNKKIKPSQIIFLNTDFLFLHKVSLKLWEIQICDLFH